MEKSVILYRGLKCLVPFPAYCQIGPPKDFEMKFVLNNGRNKFSFSYGGLRYFSTLESLWLVVKIFNLTLEWRNIVTHGQLKENLYVYQQTVLCYVLVS